MASTRAQIAIEPHGGRNIPPVLRKLMQKQNEVVEDQPSATDQPASCTQLNKTDEELGTVNKKVVQTALDSGNKKIVRTSLDTEKTKVAGIALDSGNKKVVGTSLDSGNKKVDGTALETNKNDSSTHITSKYQNGQSPTTDNINSNRNSQINVPSVFLQDSARVSECRKPLITNSSNDNKAKLFSKPDINNHQQTPGLTSLSRFNAAASFDQPKNKQLNDTNVEDKIEPSSPIVPTRIKPSTKDPFLARIANSTISLQPTTSESPTPSSHIPITSSQSDTKVVDFHGRYFPNRNSADQTIGKTTRSPISPLFSPKIHEFTKATEAGTDSSGIYGTPVPVKGLTSFISDATKNENISLQHRSDFKTFKRIKFDTDSSKLTAPHKSALPSNIDLTQIMQEYQCAIHQFKETEDGDLEDNDVYMDATSMVDILQRRSTARHHFDGVSLIHDISPQREDAPLYDEGYSPSVHVTEDDLYCDAATESKAEQETAEQVYDDGKTLVETPKASQTDQKQQQKDKFVENQQPKDKLGAKKIDEKERKEKEKEQKKRLKEEKIRIKTEKEEMQQRKHFHLTGHETNVGEGVVKQDIKTLALKKGQIVTIVRLDQNPPNMWLIKTETKMGYVSSANIEVDPATIRQAMTSHKKSLEDIYDVI